MVEPEVIEQKIRSGIPEVDHVEIQDLTGTKDHYQAVVVSSSFDGVSRIKQHQMVYKALGDLMAGPVHALTLTTLTPEAWEQQKES